MNTKKDDPAKPAAGGDKAGSRPHATLDLKATPVDPPPAKKEETVAAKVEKAASADAAKASAALPGASPRGEAGATKPEVAKRPVPTPPPGKRVGGYGGFFSHLLAGIAGGVIALLAADMLASQLGLIGPSDHEDATVALQQRIVALEAASKQKSVNPELASRIAAAEGKIDGLEKVNAHVDRLAKRQDELAGNIKAVDAKTAAKPDDAAVQARVSKLEEQLSDMSAAAAKDPQSGRLPQLAALTGKVVDLESTINTQLDALRKSVTQEVDSRLAVTNETSEAAKSGTVRIDRELAALKTDSGQLAARFDALKADADKAGASLTTTADELKKLKADVEARLATFARPEDIAGAVAPLTGKVSGLQQDLQGLVKSEGDRKTTAERIVLALELASLKRAIDRGNGFASELADAKKLSGSSVDLTPLQRYADSGVPTLAELQKEFKTTAFRMIDAAEAPSDSSVVGRLLAGAKSVVRVRKVSQTADDLSVDAVVARMEAALKDDRLGDVLAEAKTLPPHAQEVARDFLAKVEARNAVDGALASVEGQLKASLVAPSGAPAKAQ